MSQNERDLNAPHHSTPLQVTGMRFGKLNNHKVYEKSSLKKSSSFRIITLTNFTSICQDCSEKKKEKKELT